MEQTELKFNNPYNMPEGTDCYNIRIQFADDSYWAIPVEEAAYHPNELEGAATLAFQWAQQNGLAAKMMAYCSFYYLDAESKQWVYFL